MAGYIRDIFFLDLGGALEIQCVVWRHFTEYNSLYAGLAAPRKKSTRLRKETLLHIQDTDIPHLTFVDPSREYGACQNASSRPGYR